MTDKSPHIVRAADRTAENEMAEGHQLNPKAWIRGHALSRAAGLKRVGVWAVTVPAGKESFVYHRHHLEEEFMFVLAGRGLVEIEGGEHEIGPGDFVGFPPGTAHHVRNPFGEDLSYLSGGENREMEVADYPRHGKRAVRVGERVDVYAIEAGSAYPGIERL